MSTSRAEFNQQIIDEFVADFGRQYPGNAFPHPGAAAGSGERRAGLG